MFKVSSQPQPITLLSKSKVRNKDTKTTLVNVFLMYLLLTWKTLNNQSRFAKLERALVYLSVYEL